MENEQIFEQKPISAERIKEFAWDAMKDKWGIGALIVFLNFIFTVVVPAIPEAFLEEGSIGLLIWQLITVFTSAGFLFGFYACFLDNARKVPSSVARFFTAFRDFKFLLKVFATEFLQYFFLFWWTLLLIVPGIMKLYSYSMTELILVDHPEYSPLQAITASKEMMYGHRMQLFYLQVAFSLWILLCIVTFGIAGLWVSPYYFTAKSKLYLEIKDRQEKKAGLDEIVPADPVK